MLRVFVILASAAGAQALAFCPDDPKDVMWDTWLYKHGDQYILNYLVEHHDNHGNAVSTALSADGVHWADVGVGIRMDCASKAVWGRTVTFCKIL